MARRSTLAQRRFTPYDRAVLRVCRRNGWSIERDWDSLSDWEQTEWLADDMKLHEEVRNLLDSLSEQEKLFPEAYVALRLHIL